MSVIVGMSHVLRDDSRNYMPRSLSWRESFGRERSWVIDLNKSDLFPSFVEGLTAKVLGLRMADSHNSNHPEDDFTPLKPI
ncbi:hypothetical protein Tco_0625253 [Tanacetum coccineum]|uniref:Uncharacterized protein n=1 Tax=Tanacetum coccineum TaxID=301880 RepID=A0ABQ4WG99_9ASTR